MRSLTTLTVVTLAALTRGIETWNTEKMHYEMMPCTGQEPATQDARQANPSGSAKSNTAKCGVETWSTDKMTYETTPCTGTQ
jgi:hypothetical protein